MKEKLRDLAKSLGIPALGIAAAQPLSESAAQLSVWCDAGNHGAMQWLRDSEETRTNPQRLLSGAQSVIMVLWPMRQDTPVCDNSALPEGRVASFASGRDYHQVLREKLNALAEPLRVTGTEFFVFVDAEPILERAYAHKAGLGSSAKTTA